MANPVHERDNYHLNIVSNVLVLIGKKMGIIGFTNDPMCEIISPSLTTVEEPALEIGRKSCEFLLNHINKKNFPVQELTLPTRLIVRESTRRG